MFYMGNARFNENRDRVKEENPDLKFTEVAKKLGEEWRELGAKEKAGFQKTYAANKAKYEAAHKAYVAKWGPIPKKSRSKKRKGKKGRA